MITFTEETLHHPLWADEATRPTLLVEVGDALLFIAEAVLEFHQVRGEVGVEHREGLQKLDCWDLLYREPPTFLSEGDTPYKRHLLDTNASHKSLADGTGMSPQQVSNMLKGQWHPSVASLERIATHFKVEVWMIVRAAETGQAIRE